MPVSSERYLAASVKSRISRLRSGSAPATFAALLIGLFPLLYFLPATFGRIVLASDDALIFGMPLRVTIAEMIRHGHFPLWNPYLFSGMPLLAAAQGGVLFPLNWSFIVAGPRLAMNFTVLGSYAAAGVGAFFYARRAGANVLGSLVTALVWQLCGASIGQISHTSILHVFAVLPWLFWSIERYLTGPTATRALIVSGCVTVEVFAGNQQTLAYSLLLASAYIVTVGIADRNSAWPRALVFLVAGLLIAAVQILPTIELLRASLRDTATYEFFSSFSLPPVFLLTWFAPFLVGGGDGVLFRAPYISEPYYPEYVGYVGLTALALAAIVPLMRRDARTRFWTCSALICLLLALGRFAPFGFYRLVYYVPILNLFRVPARHLMEIDFSLAVLAGRAVTFLPQLPRARRLCMTAAVATSVFFLTWATVTLLRPEQFRLARVAPVSIMRAPELFLPLVFAAASAWLLFRFALARKFSRVSLLVFLVCDLALWGQFTDWRGHSPRNNDPIFSTPPVVNTLRGEKTPFRILTLDRSLATALSNGPAMSGANMALQPDTYMMHRIDNAAGYDGFGLRRYSRLAGDMKVWGEFPDQPRSLLVSRELDLLNVRHLVAAVPEVGAGAGSVVPANQSARWAEGTRIGDVMLYRNSQVLPRTWLASDSRVMTDEEKLQVIRSGKFADGTAWEPLRTVLIDAPSGTSDRAAAGEATVVRYEPNRVEIAARTTSETILVLADNHYPGWHVTVDGKRRPLLRVDYNLRGVELVPGSHAVRFIYRPASVIFGALISILSAATLGYWAWRCR
jgi:hypothetical protein